MSESLFNMGVAIIGEKHKENSPILVVGTARGGTSMVAGVLERLGVFMGDQAESPVYEDVRLSKALEAANFDEVKEISNEYSEIYCKWGWKRPSIVNYLDTVDSLLESPSYIFIFKDILSIAQRNSISMLEEILPSMERALSQYSQVCKFISDKNPYSLLVSYEKAVSNPLSFVSQLTSFYGLSPTEVQIKEAISFIQINPLDYLESSRITKSIGRIGGVNGGMVFGWARYIYSDNPASVDFFINDKKIGNLLANSYRSDLNEKYGLSCAYYFELPKSIILKKGDLLRARVVNDVRDLENSPIKVLV